MKDSFIVIAFILAFLPAELALVQRRIYNGQEAKKMNFHTWPASARQEFTAVVCC